MNRKEHAAMKQCPRCKRWFRDDGTYTDHAWNEKP